MRRWLAAAASADLDRALTLSPDWTVEHWCSNCIHVYERRRLRKTSELTHIPLTVEKTRFKKHKLRIKRMNRKDTYIVRRSAVWRFPAWCKRAQFRPSNRPRFDPIPSDAIPEGSSSPSCAASHGAVQCLFLVKVEK